MLLQAVLELTSPPEDSYAWRNGFSLLQAQHLSLWESTANRPTNKRKAIVNVKNSFTFLYFAYESGDVCVYVYVCVCARAEDDSKGCLFSLFHHTGIELRA